MLVRSRPCSCGSGRPARRCCGRFRRVSEREAAAAHVQRQSRTGWETVSPFSTSALAALQAEAASLPTRSDVFRAALSVARDPVAGDLRRLARALQRVGNPEHPAVQAALRRADTPIARAAIAKAMTSLRESGEVDEYLAGAGLFELGGYRSALTDAALLQAATRRAPEPRRAPASAPRPVMRPAARVAK